MARFGGISNTSGSTGGGSTTARAIAEGGTRPRFSIQARMRGEGARLNGLDGGFAVGSKRHRVEVKVEL